MRAAVASETPAPAAFPRVAGVYVAWHPWLDRASGGDNLYKVGHTGDLSRRLHDSAYWTCFPNGWVIKVAAETPDKDSAHLLETAVLHCCRHHRVDGRELVKLPLAQIREILEGAAADLGAEVGVIAIRDHPLYPRPAPGESAGAGAGAPAEPAPPTAWTACAARVEWRTVPAFDGDALLDGLLAGLTLGDGAGEGLGGVSALPPAPALPPALPPRPPPAPVQKAGGGADAASKDELADELADELEDFVLVDALDDVASPAPEYRMQGVEPREYQREAAHGCLRELASCGRAVLQMACRCGKTPVAYAVLCAYLGRACPAFGTEALPGATGRAVLLLVPGLSLLRQTAQKLASYGLDAPLLLVGSDPRPVTVPGTPAPREMTMTTDRGAIAAFLARKQPRLVLSTYQSSPLVPTDAFALTVFDECHRVCGGAAPRPFSHHVQAPRAGARLFMTATPAFDPPSKSPITMKDRETFGGVAAKFHLRQGIEADVVNPFRLEVVAAADPGGRDAAQAALPAQLHAALAQVDKLLVFCRDIGHAESLCAALAAAPLPAGVAPFASLCGHSRQKAGAATAALQAFARPGVRAALFSVRMFQEGVEIPALNAVFFAAPRHSPRDIIQSICRPLNRVAGKPASVVFLPVLHDPGRPPLDPSNLTRYATIVPFVDALLDEDPRLYDHLLDPEACEFPLDLLGAHTLPLPADATARRAAQAGLLAAVRHAVRYKGSTARRPVERLLKAKRVPWEHGFGELKRVVAECHRYPKTNDLLVVGQAKASLYAIYRYYAEEFLAWQEGRPCALEPWQLHALDSLEGWRAYGVLGPYPWPECMGFLEQWLDEHNGIPPMVNINNGGYIGLDASAMERLSGAMTVVNQSDGRDRPGGAPGSGFTLDPKKQADLDRICAKFGLRWRKQRDDAGSLVDGGPKTFIQEAYERFKAYYAEHGTAGAFIQRWYEGFPLKNRRMERMGLPAGVAPPTKKGRKPSGPGAKGEAGAGAGASAPARARAKKSKVPAPP